MEDWLAFIETFSPYIFYKLPWKPEDKHIQQAFETQWSHLRQGTLAIMRQHPGSHTAERMRQAEQHFEAYGASAEEVRAANHAHHLLQTGHSLQPRTIVMPYATQSSDVQNFICMQSCCGQKCATTSGMALVAICVMLPGYGPPS